MPVCTDCGGTVIEYDHAAGNGFCVGCGTVVEENTIVNEIGFGETAGGAAIVQGSFVGQGATHARMSGPYGNRGSNESREQTIANANKKIQSIANVLKLSEVVCLAATRMYTLAVEHKFTKGRKSMNVVAVCLYVACRQKETRNYMLIDFSDLLQVNVFELGHTYLQLVQTLNLRLPLVDPSHYISRFAALLEFGDETHRVATDAVRLVQRFDRDWMTRGRRPAGICGAALLLAARMNNFRRSVEEIVQVVKIADTTLKKRLEEFKATPSGALTLADFRNVWLDEEMDPPAFTKGKEREEMERAAALEAEAAEGEEDEGVKAKAKGKGKGKSKKGGKKRKGKRKRGEETDDDDANRDANQSEVAALNPSPLRQRLDPSMLSESILADVIDPASMEILSGPTVVTEVDDSNIDPALLEQSMPRPSLSSATAQLQSQTQVQKSPTQGIKQSQPLFIPSPPSSPSPTPMTLIDETTSSILAEEVSGFLHNPEGSMLAEALKEADQRRLAAIEERRLAQMEQEEGDELLGLNEEELDRFILNEDEVRIKERVWVELNKDYLEAIAAKGDQDGSSASKSKKRRKTNNKPRDASSAAGDTAAESVRNLIKKNPKYSKRINYDALKDLFVDEGNGKRLPYASGSGGMTMVTRDDEKDDDVDLYTMDEFDDKTDEGGVGMPRVILEEEPGTVVLKPVDTDGEGGRGKKKKGVEMLASRMQVDADEESDEEEKEADIDWLDAYEQEV